MRNRLGSVVGTLIFTSGLFCFSSTPYAGLIFEDDFESGNLNNWTIGGRQQAGINLANTVNRYGSTVGHLYKTSFTEITLSNDFAYDSSLNFMFDIEVTSSGAITPPFYSSSSADFDFYDSSGDRLGNVWYGTFSTDFIADLFSSDPARHLIELSEGALVNLDVSVADILSFITIDEASIDYVQLRLRTYTSWFGNGTAELWVDNVCVDQGDVCQATTTIPEPASVALISLGLAGIGYRRRKQIKAA